MTGDAITRWLDPLGNAARTGAGLLLIAAGLALSFLVVRWLGRRVPRPDPPATAAPLLDALPREWPTFARWIAWITLRLGHGEPKSFRPLLLPASALALVAATALGSLAASRNHAPAAVVDLHAASLASIVIAAVLLAFFSVWTRSFGGSLADLGITRRHVGRSLALALVLYVAYAPVQLGALALERGLYGFAGREPPGQAMTQAFAADPKLHGDPIVLAAIVLCVPLYEELLFRGVLLRFFGRLLPAATALAALTACFAALHDAGWLTVFALGLALGWLMQRTGNLFASLAFHALHNGLALWLLATTARP